MTHPEKRSCQAHGANIFVDDRGSVAFVKALGVKKALVMKFELRCGAQPGAIQEFANPHHGRGYAARSYASRGSLFLVKSDVPVG